MDDIVTTSSFHYVMSKFADLLIKVKQRMDKLRIETREAVDKLKEEGNDTEQSTDCPGVSDIKSLIDATMVKLERRLIALETFCNASLVRMFLYVSNYTSTVPKLDEGHEVDMSKVIQTHNIVFPDYSEDDFVFNENYLFNECFMDDASERTDYPRSCRRPSDLQSQEFCLNKQY